MRLTWIVAGMVALAGANVALADNIVETFDNPGGALDGILTPGQDGPWTLSIEDGMASLENATDPNAIKFYRVEKLRGGASPAGAAVAVDVAGEFPTRNSGAGILYQHDQATRSYLAFVIGSRRWTLYQRGVEGMRPRLSGELPRGKNPARRLRIQPDGENLVLEIDGQPIGRVRIANLPGSAVGIVGVSKGRFTFDNLAIIEAGG
ncbi:MAG TPA: hypothetical protein VHL31_23730 [Geminicoccus sp.]|jgi:hypothetical protein|uniref:hypothetical protein n=1 Tax=Geminicoccus sp. TaxID=2024832 RepID=UPI002E33C858|nr:hypothetical protein [Geminicoccus sp.]HEX2529291.1 hypothetical protein [Geminicoccus sp.]